MHFRVGTASWTFIACMMGAEQTLVLDLIINVCHLDS